MLNLHCKLLQFFVFTVFVLVSGLVKTKIKKYRFHKIYVYKRHIFDFIISLKKCLYLFNLRLLESTEEKVENLSMARSTTLLVQGTRMLFARVSNGGSYIKTISSANSKHLEWTKYPQTGHTITSMICRTLYLMYILRLQVFLN